MAINYNWRIYQLDAKANYDNKTNVVFCIHWGLEGVDSDDDTMKETQVGATNLIINNIGDDFIDYDNLAKEQVIQWIESKEDVEGLKNILSEKIQLKKQPVDVHLRPNWDNENINTI
jgi:hypothetical protein